MLEIIRTIPQSAVRNFLGISYAISCETKKYPKALADFRVFCVLGGKLSYNVNVNSLQTTVALSGIEGNFLAIL